MTGAGRRNLAQGQLLAAFALALIATFARTPHASWLPFQSLLAVESTLVIALGFWLKDRAIRQAGLLGTLVVGATVWSAAALTWGLVLPVVATWYAAMAMYKYLDRSVDTPPYPSLFDALSLPVGTDGVDCGYAVAASVLLAWGCASLLSHWQLAAAWSLEGFGLMALSLLMRDHLIRRLGLAVIGLLTLARIGNAVTGSQWFGCSLLIAGVAMGAAGYANHWFAQRLAGGDAPGGARSDDDASSKK